MLRQKPFAYLAVATSFVGYYFLGYEIPRHDTLPLFSAFGILFLIYLWIVYKASDQEIGFWIITSFCFRVILVFALPQLSDDFYRFIWDGRLWAAGQNPFAAVPSAFLTWNIPGIDQEIYNQLNSKDYFSVYPPVAQYIFWVAVKISPYSISGSVLVMRAFILMAEFASILLLKKLLVKYNVATKNILFYALNPFIILELTGNLHFEAFVIFFLLLAVLFFTQNKLKLSAVGFGFAICAKLIPLIFLPLFIGRLSRKNLFLYFSVVAITCLLLFFPFFDLELFHSLGSSVGLYFNKFEFNASLYYLVREFGYSLYGYNIIQTVGWKLALITLVLILGFVWIRHRQSVVTKVQTNNQILLEDWMWILSIYFLFTTTLHPWYISTLLAFSVFTPYRFIVLWTGLIFFTYAGYTVDSFHEVLWLTALEYILVMGYLIYELRKRSNAVGFRWNNKDLFRL